MSSSSIRRVAALAATLLVTAQIIMLQIPGGGSEAQAAASELAPFQRVWSRTDEPIAAGKVARTWMWGPAAVSGLSYEPYVESPGGQRIVQYFDKSRMEITQPGAPDDGLWYVTNGLLVVELVSGRRQIGDAASELRTPANVNVAGDPDDTSGPTYASFGSLLDAQPAASGSFLTRRLTRDGSVTDDATLARWGATAGSIDEVTHHAIADPFWAFMTAKGLIIAEGVVVTAPLFESPYYATGRPISEAYWATVRVGGTPRDVLMQCFERRCLTWTPENPPDWRVEAGNVGLHYLAWQTEQDPPIHQTPTGATTTATATSLSTSGPNPTATKTPTPIKTSTPTKTPTSTKTPTPTKTPTLAPTATTGPQHGTDWFTDGTWNIGEDVSAGTWRNSDSSAGCHWQRLSSLSAVIVESLSHEIQTVTIEPGDAYFRSTTCGTWTLIAAYPTPTPIPPATATPGGSGEAACLNAAEAEVLRLLNVERQKAGLSALTNSRALNVASYRHSLDMTTRDYFDHNTLAPLPAGQSGPSFVDRVRDAGYSLPASGWAAGENIAWGHATAQAVVSAWMASQGHKDNILNPLFTQVGIGFASNPDAYYWNVWTTDFANGNDGPGC
ncbi:MAG TPA: CAP domain-containing protein [Thermomicrobiales bacterium]|nr:CAP domain-containing protein [Thermomicrobiales bacterium]HRA30618.1 CAP domain-containing protein [Thermomicrobiales bacterium]